MNHFWTGLMALALVSSLATGCVSSAPNADDGTITQEEGVKAFADAVLGHCVPAIHTGQDFADFEVRGVTPLARLGDNKISMFQDKQAPTWQMVEGVVQIQHAPGQTCHVLAYGLPVKATFRIVGDAIIRTDYGYEDDDVGFPQEGMALQRILVSRSGDKDVTVFLEGKEAGAEGTLGEFSTLSARVVKTAEAG